MYGQQVVPFQVKAERSAMGRVASLPSDEGGLLSVLCLQSEWKSLCPRSPVSSLAERISTPLPPPIFLSFLTNLPTPIPAWVNQRSSKPPCESFKAPTPNTLLMDLPVCVGVLQAASCSLYSAAELHEAERTVDLPLRTAAEDPVYVHLDHRSMGVGGDNSWFPDVVHEEYTVSPKKVYRFTVRLEALAPGQLAPLAALAPSGKRFDR